jgi:ATP-binding cassette subfamily B protein
VHATELDLSYFERAEFYDTLQRATREGPVRPVLALAAVVRMGEVCVTLGSMVIVLSSTRWWGILLLGCAAAPQLLWELRFARREYELLCNLTPEQRESDYLAHTLTSNEYAKEVKLFESAKLFVDRHRALFWRGHNEEKRVKLAGGIAGAVCAVASALSYSVFLLHLIVQVASRHLSLGTFTLLAGAFQQSAAQLISVVRTSTRLYEHSLHLHNVWRFLDLEPTLAGAKAALGHRTRPRMRKGVEFRGVSFRYPGSTTWALRDVSFDLPRNRSVALVGRNGSGKSTVAKLLCRLHDPEGGAVLLDGTDIRNYDPRDYRCLVSAVFQDYSRYQLSASTNIAVGHLASRNHGDRIRYAAALAGIDELIRSLPQGYDTVLGRAFADGTELSQGEWQRIALARALLRPARIVVLDEVTASLDSENEDVLMQTFAALLRGRAVLLVTHRLSTAKMADSIIVMDKGRVCETGSHETLVKRAGLYASWYASQESRYKCGDGGQGGHVTLSR